MAINRVDYNNNTLIDLTSDTVTAADLSAGVTAHDRSGTPITGTANYQPRTMDSSVTIGAETETTVEGAIGELADLVPSTAAPTTNKLATAADVNGEEITVTASTSPVSTASGSLHKIAIYGKSEVVDGAIHSAGEGWATVDLGTLDYSLLSTEPYPRFATNSPLPNIKAPTSTLEVINGLCTKLNVVSAEQTYYGTVGLSVQQQGALRIYYPNCTSVSEFKAAMSGVLLCYELADSTQGNCIAVKTDNGSGINGTMAVFETGTPLRGIPETDVRDVMEWDGSAGAVTKKCGEVDLGTLNWYKTDNGRMYAPNQSYIKKPTDAQTLANILCPAYTADTDYNVRNLVHNNSIAIGGDNAIYVYDSDYTDPAAFKTAMNGVKLVYELATPTTTPFTTAENNSFAALQTYSPQTAIAINDSPEFEVEAYAGTTNGKVVSELEEKVQKQLEGKITVSTTLTLAANAWSNNTQTVTFAHDTTKRNVIDITPSEVPAWAAAGVYASAETSAGITFTCATVPETALTFKVTSMEVS